MLNNVVSSILIPEIGKGTQMLKLISKSQIDCLNNYLTKLGEEKQALKYQIKNICLIVDIKQAKLFWKK